MSGTKKSGRSLNDMTGQRFGHWTVTGKSHRDKHGVWHWDTVCDCGATSKVAGSKLRCGRSSQCVRCAAGVRAFDRQVAKEAEAQRQSRRRRAGY